MCGAVKPLFALPFYFLRLLQGWKSLNQSKRAAASVDEFHQLCDSPISGITTKAPCEVVLMSERHVRIEISDFVYAHFCPFRKNNKNPNTASK